MANWQAGVGGAAAGAGTGAAIGTTFGPIGTGVGAIAGGLIGGIAGLFGGGDDDAIQAQIKLWQDAITRFQNDPTDKEALAQLQSLTQAGLTDQERSEMLTAATSAGAFSRGQRQAIQQTAAARGGGVSSSGMSTANQELAAQGASQSYAQQAQQAAGQASQRRTAAVEAYNQELDRRQQLMQYLQSGLSGAYAGEQNYNEANTEAMMQNIAAGGSAAVGALKMPGGAKAPAAAAPPPTYTVNPVTGPSLTPLASNYSPLNSYLYG